MKRIEQVRELVRSGVCPVEHDHVPPDEIPGYWDCFWCEGHGRVERYDRGLRRRALVTCEHCEGTGRT